MSAKKPSDMNDLATIAGKGAVKKVIDGAVKQHQAQATGRNVSRLLTTCAASVKPEPVRWFWPGRIALGKLTLIAGDPGLGKSMLTANLASHCSTGTAFTDGGACPLGDVLFASAEDDPADTIRPRLDAAKADPNRVHIVSGIESFSARGDVERRLLSLRHDVDAIREAALDLPQCRLIVIDPVSAYLGGLDGHNNAEVRALLAPLADLGRDVGAAIVAVTHLNKGSGGQALYRATGSLAFVAAARAAWAVARDKTDAERRLFLPMKNNIGKDTSGLSYRIAEDAGVAAGCGSCLPACILISLPSTLTAKATAMSEARHYPKVATKARQWLPLHTHSEQGGFLEGRKERRECKCAGEVRKEQPTKNANVASPIGKLAGFAETRMVEPDSQRSPMAGFDGVLTQVFRPVNISGKSLGGGGEKSRDFPSVTVRLFFLAAARYRGGGGEKSMNKSLDTELPRPPSWGPKTTPLGVGERRLTNGAFWRKTASIANPAEIVAPEAWERRSLRLLGGIGKFHRFTTWRFS